MTAATLKQPFRDLRNHFPNPEATKEKLIILRKKSFLLNEKRYVNYINTFQVLYVYFCSLLFFVFALRNLRTSWEDRAR